MLGPAQTESWRRDGFLVARGLVPAAVCEATCDALWRALGTAHGIRQDAPDTWRDVMPRGLARHFRPEDAADLGSTPLPGLIDDLLGRGNWDPSRAWAQPLPVFPTKDEWDVPAKMWHLDYPVRGMTEPLFAVKMLCLLAPLEPRGGGTLLLAGSHTLLARRAAIGRGGNSSDVRRHLCAEDPWLKALMSPDGSADERVQRFMVEGAVVDGVALRVVEFSGAAGDAVLFHPWLLHNVSPNCRETPRMMVGQNFTTREGLRIYQRRTM